MASTGVNGVVAIKAVAHKLARGLGRRAANHEGLLGLLRRIERDGREAQEVEHLKAMRHLPVALQAVLALDQAGAEAIQAYEAAMKCNDLRGAADAAWRIVTAANQYIVQTAPWVLAKGGQDAELDAALASLARCLYRMAILASPLMPGKAEELWGALGQPGEAAAATWASLAAPPVTGAHTRKPDGLFPRPEPTVSS